VLILVENLQVQNPERNMHLICSMRLKLINPCIRYVTSFFGTASKPMNPTLPLCKIGVTVDFIFIRNVFILSCGGCDIG